MENVKQVLRYSSTVLEHAGPGSESCKGLKGWENQELAPVPSVFGRPLFQKQKKKRRYGSNLEKKHALDFPIPYLV